MGIVVTVFMLLGLLLLLPLSAVKPLARLQEKKRQKVESVHFVGIGLFVAGAWNSFWHGLRFLDYFWGVAAVVSGLFMMLTAVIILKRYGHGFNIIKPLLDHVYRVISPLSFIWVVGLLLSFLLYSVTLVQLNLGLPILG